MNIQKYSLALITCLESSKNPSAVARELGINQSTSSRFLTTLDFDESTLESAVVKLFGKKKLAFVIDDTVIGRPYSQETEGISSMVDQSDKRFTMGYKIVVGGLTDGRFFLPINFEQWIAEFIMQKDYRKTTEIAKVLILKVIKLGLNIDCFVLDGLYFCEEFLHWLNERNLRFIIKSKTTTSVIYKDKKMQLQDCKDLRLNSNQSNKKIFAQWTRANWHFVAVRRSGKRGPKIIYLISNFKTKSKIYAKIYDFRWMIEKCFRTCKQHLGLKNSLSQYARTYLNHIRCVFFAYTLMQFLMKKFRLESVEDAIRKAQSIKNKYGFSSTLYRISLLENYA